MSDLILLAAGAGTLALIVTLLAIGPVSRLALATRAVDYPGGRKSHEGAVPRLGGVGIMAGLAAGTALASAFWSHWWVPISTHELAALGVATLLIFLVGVAEDLLGMRPVKRFLVQTGAAFLVVAAGWFFRGVYVPLVGEVELGAWGALLTVIWIVGVTNAINLLDGLDGLAGGVAAIMAGSILVLACTQGNGLAVVLMASTVGACLGFLRYNWAPARVYMGDSGSLVLGFLLAVLSMHASIKAPAAVAILVPLLALGLPVIDTLLVMLVRLAEKPQGPVVRRFARVFRADRNHLHHLMCWLAMERKQIVYAIYLVAAGFCMMALLVAITRDAVLGAVLVAVEVCVVGLLRVSGMRAAAREQALRERREIRETVFAPD